MFLTRVRRMRTARRVSRSTTGAAGFSFLEIMLVVVIIGILASIVGPKLLGRTEKAKIQAARSQLNAFKTCLVAYEMEVGEIPTTEQGLEALAERPSDVDEDIWSQQIEEIPIDPWKRPYVYRSPGEDDSEYDVFSEGPDKKEGTDDDVWLTRRGNEE